MQLLFIDFDGTICAPNYLVDRTYTIGMSLERWLVFIAEKKEKIFEDCKPVEAVLSYARKKKAEGAKLYVLTRTGGENEDAGKKAFLQKWCPDLFDEYISVRNDSEKCEVIREKATDEQVALSDCILVEDTYSILLDAVAQGITGMHVSNVFLEYTGES